MEIVIVGASCRAAAQRAVMAGYTVIAADLFVDRDLQACATAIAVEDLHDLPWDQLDVAGKWVMLAGGMENTPMSIKALINRGAKIGIDESQLSMLRSIDNWKRWAEASNLKWPVTLRAENVTSSREMRDAWLAKAYHSSAGMAVEAWNGQSIGQNRYLQQRVDGRPISAIFLSDVAGVRLLGLMGSLTKEDAWGPSEFAYRGSFGPLQIPIGEDAIRRFGEMVHNEVQLRGLWNADFQFDGDDAWLLEINPRWSASMELLDAWSGIRLVDLHARAVKGERLSIPNFFSAPSRQNAVSLVIEKRVVYAEQNIQPTVDQLANWWDHRWRGELSELATEPRLADIPSTTAMIPKGAPIYTVVSKLS